MKALVILSGGQDSTTCLFWAKQCFSEVYAVTYDYGQRHSLEIRAACHVADLAGVVEHKIVEVGPILQGTSPLVSKAELEQYPDMYSLPGGLEKTFVPGRNMLFLTLAANHAYVRGMTHLVMGVCEEDYGGYPDCRELFINAAGLTLSTGFDCDFSIHTPLMHLTKAQSVKLAFDMPRCWEALAYTHTAYDGLYPPTGHDHASLLRAKGFLEAGLPDPLVVRACKDGLMTWPGTTNYTETPMSKLLP